MVKGKIKQNVALDKPEMNYRKLDALNQSMLKVFDTDPIRFFEEFKLGKKRRDKKSTALAIGDMVDFYLLACRGNEDDFHNRFDERFALFTGTKGSGQVYTLVDILFELTERDTEDGVIKTSFDVRFTEACQKVQADGKYKGKTEDKIMEDFEKNGTLYFATLMENIGKTVVDTSLVDKALSVAKRIQNDPFTHHLFVTYDMEEYFTHYPIVFKYMLDEKRSILCKAELDLLIVNHEDKTIQPKDLKTTYDNESFDYMYIKNSYYLQNAFYMRAVKEWAKENNLEDYKIIPMEFIVGDTSANNRRPLIFSTSEEDVMKGSNGFDFRGNHYRGVHELISEIAWCEENEVWNCSRESFLNNGQMKLNIKYDN